MLIAAEKVSKKYTERALLDECSLYIDERDKIGVVGLNGAGKSTLLKIIAQVEEPDAGVVTMQRGLRIGYLSQNPVLDDDASVLQQVLAKVEEAQKDVQEYEAKTILNKLGIADFDSRVGTLSGGQKKRVAMAAVLVAPCDVLILDEPTNHLDNDMIVWLETYLIKYAGAVLMVTHDRYFLDRVATKMVEIVNGAIHFYEANYSKYLEMKLLREEMEIAAERKRKSLFRKELEWISRGPRARGTKSKSRIERFEILSEQTGTSLATKLELSSISTRLGKKTIEIENISKSFDHRPVIQKFSHIIARDARIGIVGKNGAGKSTLLNLISGSLKPDSGVVVVGDTVKIAYFKQHSVDMDPAMRVIDYMKEFGETVETAEGTLTASQMLEKFLFSPELQWNTVGRLSGGERRRLYLLTLLMQAPNIFILDEPTNDLDIETLMILEDYLDGFQGGVLVVSHDRYFLDKVADLIWEIEDDGTVIKYQGKYTDYLQQKQERVAEQEAAAKEKQVFVQLEKATVIKKKIKFSFNEQREYQVIDEQIAELELKKEALEKEITAAVSNYELLQDLLEQKTEVEAKLDAKLERWIYLNEIAEKISSQ